MKHITWFFALIVMSAVSALSFERPLNAETQLKIELDVSEAKHLAPWGEKAVGVIKTWHGRIENLLPTKDFDGPKTIKLRIKKSDKGVGATAGNRIIVSSHWVEKKPDDSLGMIIHELTHVVQSYRGAQRGYGWVTEGIADYIRWCIYEGKPLSWFPKPKAKDGYTKGYRVAAGFFFWLETDRAPGIVKRLNTAMRNRENPDDVFKAATGKLPGELWQMYLEGK